MYQTPSFCPILLLRFRETKYLAHSQTANKYPSLQVCICKFEYLCICVCMYVQMCAHACVCIQDVWCRRISLQNQAWIRPSLTVKIAEHHRFGLPTWCELHFDFCANARLVSSSLSGLESEDGLSLEGQSLLITISVWPVRSYLVEWLGFFLASVPGGVL